MILVLVAISACQTESTVTSLNPPSLTLLLDAPKEVRASEVIRLKLTLRNTGSEPVEVMLGGRPPYDFVMTSADSAQEWRWSDGNAAQMILQLRTLQPREEIAYDVQWAIKNAEGNVPRPGRYLLRAILNMDPPERMETAPRELVVIGR